MKQILLLLITLVTFNAFAYSASEVVYKEVQVVKCVTKDRSDLIGQKIDAPGFHENIREASQIKCVDPEGRTRVGVVSAIAGEYPRARSFTWISYMNTRNQTVFTKQYGPSEDFEAALRSSTFKCPTVITISKNHIRGEFEYDITYNSTCDILD